MQVQKKKLVSPVKGPRLLLVKYAINPPAVEQIPGFCINSSPATFTNELHTSAVWSLNKLPFCLPTKSENQDDDHGFNNGKILMMENAFLA